MSNGNSAFCAIGPISFGIAKSVSQASPLEALLSGQLGPITSEGLFLLMSELMEEQNLKISQKTAEFRDQTALQEKYSQFLAWMQAAQSAATRGGGQFLDRGNVESMLQGMGYTSPYFEEMRDKIFALAETRTIGETEVAVVSPDRLALFLNEEIFGKGNEHLYVDIPAPQKNDDGYTSGTFKQEHFDVVTEKIEAAQKKNCKDTTLMTTELNQLISHQERISNMFSNVLKKFHDTEMAIIRNI